MGYNFARFKECPFLSSAHFKIFISFALHKSFIIIMLVVACHNGSVLCLMSYLDIMKCKINMSFGGLISCVKVPTFSELRFHPYWGYYPDFNFES